jgi:putrescine aminotransferase
MFGMSHWGVVPDIVTMAKSITAGYAPLGAVCAQQWIYDALDVFPDVHTFGGHPIAARAALEVIDILEEGGIDQARSTGTHLQLALELVTRHDIVGETRGIGMWAAIDFTLDRTTRAPMPRETVRRILRRTRELGVILTSNGSALEFAPRLDAPTDEIDHGVEVFDQAIADVASTL